MNRCRMLQVASCTFCERITCNKHCTCGKRGTCSKYWPYLTKHNASTASFAGGSDDDVWTLLSQAGFQACLHGSAHGGAPRTLDPGCALEHALTVRWPCRKVRTPSSIA